LSWKDFGGVEEHCPCLLVLKATLSWRWQRDLVDFSAR
jgi:hypothetical protein